MNLFVWFLKDVTRRKPKNEAKFGKKKLKRGVYILIKHILSFKK